MRAREEERVTYVHKMPVVRLIRSLKTNEQVCYDRPSHDKTFFITQIHTGCRDQYPRKCPLGQCRLSILPPTAISSIDSDGYWEGMRPPGTSPLLVYVNTKSGDNQVGSFQRHITPTLSSRLRKWLKELDFSRQSDHSKCIDVGILRRRFHILADRVLKD